VNDQTPSPQTAELKKHLKDLRRLASWGKAPDDPEFKDLADRCLALDAACQPLIDETLAKGGEEHRLLQPFYRFGTRLGKAFTNHPDYLAALDSLKRQRPDLVQRARTQAEKGAAAKARALEAQVRTREGQSMTRVRAPGTATGPSSTPLPAPSRTDLPAGTTPAGLHPRDLRALSPRPAWQLLIDETGTEFGPAAAALSPADRSLGRFIGLFLPATAADHGLRPLTSGWHAVDQSIAELDRVIQGILDAPVGVLGITVQQLPAAPGERWAFGVIRLVDLALRLLPMAGPTRLEVLIEQRGHEFQGGTQWPAVAEQARLRLAEVDPERGGWLDLRIRTIRKTDSPYNGYVDALAFIAAQSADYSRACLAASGLAGTCLLDGDAETLTRIQDWLNRGRNLDGRDWSLLLAHPQSEQPANLTATLLARLGAGARRDPDLWKRYLDYVMAHFDSRSLDLPTLGRQVIWLQTWAPPAQQLPPTLQLLWYTAQLARANHLGQTEQPWIAEMQALADRLMEEDARLVCRAELNLAVTATNGYDFAAAGQALARWNPSEPQQLGKLRRLIQRVIGNRPTETGDPASPARAAAGLRYWAQVRSSLGQHAAFTGNLPGAVAFFDEAIDSFRQLSDPEQARRDLAQTQTYRAIALMDDPRQDPDTVRAAVETVTGPLPEALIRLARSVANADKYAHHLVLRWLAQRPEPALAETYLAERDGWDRGEGHPWPLIQIYRALLLHGQDSEGALQLAMDSAAIADAPDSGPVVRLIGACGRAIAVGWGQPWSAAETELNRLRADLPLAAPRLDRLAAYLRQPTAPMTLLKEVLPFNFR
jgi:hypothetical protein